jgi:hypothetical protein
MRYTVKVNAGTIERTDGDTRERVPVEAYLTVTSTSHGEAEAEALAIIGDYVRGWWRATEHGETPVEADPVRWESDHIGIPGLRSHDLDVDEMTATAVDVVDERGD